MAIEIREVSPDSLEQYGQIPMRHRVESVFRVDEIDGGFGVLELDTVPSGLVTGSGPHDATET